MKKEIKIAIIGLGYVGLPLARLFATKYKVVGFDINKERVAELKKGIDATLEVENEVLQKVLVDHSNSEKGLFCTTSLEDIKNCNYYIVTVPTPVDKNNKPDLTPLVKSSETVGSVLKQNDIVIYESTVFPGATEEVCVPILEQSSGLKFNTDFYVGYSPERINPGDKEHTLTKIVKVSSGSDPEAAEIIAQVGVGYDNISVKSAESKKIKVTNPATGDLIAEIPNFGKKETTNAIDSADKLHV